MNFKNTRVYNIDQAIMGARHAYESYDKSDTYINKEGTVTIGPNDMDLCQRLINGDLHSPGDPNSKFLRQIMVSVDITAPIYWWKEADTYKVGTVANSQSTMHRLSTTPITIDCFEIDDYTHSFNCEDEHGSYIWDIDSHMAKEIKFLEKLRIKYLETKDIRYWKELIRWLPESWLQTRKWTANYEVLRNMWYWRVRTPHKLTEWKTFGNWIDTLPYANELIKYEGKNI